MIYGYLRVSTDMQDVESQKQGVVSLAERNGWTIDTFISDEGVSGAKDPSKRKLGPLLKKLKKGDIIIASEISRLGRDLFMVMEILHHCMERGCIVYTVKDNYVLGDNITSKVLAFAFGLAAEIERQMIRQRTAEGIKRRMLLGILMGRPPGKMNDPKKYKLYGKDELIKGLMAEDVSKRKIADILKIDRNTFYRYLAIMRERDEGIIPNGWYQRRDKVSAKMRARRKAEANSTRKYEYTDLPRNEVREMILNDKTIPEIHAHYGGKYTYWQVYDSISIDEELHPLYRQHAQIKLMKQYPRSRARG